MSILDRLEEEYDKDEAQVFYVGNIQTMKIYLNDIYVYIKLKMWL